MDKDNVKVSLEIATQAAELALKNLKKTTEENNSTWDIFKGNFAAGLALDSLKKGYTAVTGFVSSVIDESSKAEQSVRNMNVALQNAGLYSEQTSQDFQNYADELERTTAFSGEAAEASLTLFTNLTTLSKDGIMQATSAASDLAATLNIDLGSASEMIAKAVNGNVTAFAKMGIEIQKGRTDSENLTNVLTALSSQQGAAAKQSETFSGSLAKLNNQKGKLLESIGNLITKNPILTKLMSELANATDSLSGFISDNSEEITLFAESLLIATAAVGAAAVAVKLYTISLGTAAGAMTVLSTAAAAAWTIITGPIGLAVAGIALLTAGIYLGVKYWKDIQIATYEATAAVLEYAAKGAEIFNSDLAAQLRDEAKAFGEKADAVRIAQAAEIEAQNAAKAASEGQAGEGDAARRQKELEELKQFNAEKLEEDRAYRESLLLEGMEQDLLVQEQAAAHEQALYSIAGQYDGERLAAELLAQEQRLLMRQEFERSELAAKMETEKQKALLIEDGLKREQALLAVGNKTNLEKTKLANKQELDLIKQRNKTAEQLQADKINNQKSTFATIASLSSSSNRELAIIGKAAALTQIAIDTPVAISKAIASGIPYPANLVAAAAVGVAMAAQAAQVAGINFATGGIVPGSSFSGDKVTANVNSREMVLNVAQQKKLFEIANGRSEGSGGDMSTTNRLLADLITAVKENQSIQIDGKEVFSVFRSSIQAGRTV